MKLKTKRKTVPRLHESKLAQDSSAVQYSKAKCAFCNRKKIPSLTGKSMLFPIRPCNVDNSTASKINFTLK